MALAPAVAQSWTANEPRPPDAPQTRNIVARTEDVWTMAKQHTIGGGQGERVTSGFFPGQVLRARHELLGLGAAELGKGAIRGFISPDALGRREHRIATVAFLVVTVILVAVDHNLVADLPALYLGADSPDNAGRI